MENLEREDLEYLSTEDPSVADGYIAYFKHGENRFIAVAMVFCNVRIMDVERLNGALCQRGYLSHNLTFTILNSYNPISPRTIMFDASGEEFADLFKLFVAYVKQCRVIINPIVTDMTMFSLEQSKL